MKTILTLSLLLFSITFTKAQSGFGLDGSANWQQYISSVLGGNCVQISNVQYLSGPLASGYFVNGQNVIGLEKGIVISTGQVNDQSGNNISSSPSDFMHSSNSLPGDGLLDFISGSFTFDAAILEFDFIASIDDTVYVRYVFASEEYPDFAPPNFSSFNDIFGFFVSGGGYNNQNIALLPNSSTTVSINSINAITNPSYYLSEHPNLVYDGYTVPLTATFVAVAGVTYHLKIAIADGGDSSYDSAVFLESLELGIQQISGTTNLNGNAITSGFVELFGLNTDSLQANLVSSYDLTTGDFQFSNIESGSYILKVTPDATVYPGALPKYFNEAYLWANATILSLPCSDFTFGLSLAPITNGSSSLSGVVHSTTSTLKVTQDFEDFQPAVGVDIWLFNNATDQVIAHTTSNSSGVYTFQNIEAGNYRILVDLPGLAMAEMHTITIDENQNLNNLDYLVGKNKIVKYGESISINNLQNKTLVVFPNPFEHSIQIKGLKNGNCTISICDLSGRMLFTTNLKPSENQTLSIPTEALQKGIYLLTTEQNGERNQIKIVK